MGYKPTAADFADTGTSQGGYTPTAQDFAAPEQEPDNRSYWSQFSDRMTNDLADYRKEQSVNEDGSQKTDWEKMQSITSNPVSRFERRFGANALSSIGETGKQFHNLMSDLGVPGMTKLPDTNFDEVLGIKDPNVVDSLMKLAPEIVGSLLVPEAKGIQLAGKIGKYLNPASRVISNAVRQGGVAAAFNPKDAVDAATTATASSAPFFAVSEAIGSNSPKVRTAARVGRSLLGALMGGELGNKVAGGYGGAAGAALGAITGGRGVHKDEVRKIKKAMDKNPDYAKRMEAARRQGVDLRPAEALDSPAIATQQGKLERGDKTQQIMYDSGQARVKQEEKAINKFYDSVSSKEDEAKIDKLYSKSGKVKVDKKYQDKWEGKATRSKTVETKEGEVIAKKDLFEAKPGQDFVETLDGEIILKKDFMPEAVGKVKGGKQIFKDAVKELESDKAYTDVLKGAHKNSIKYYDQVKRKLYAKEKAYRLKGDNAGADNIAKVRKNMVKELDQFSKDYALGRKFSEAQKTREKIENSLNEGDVKGSNFYTKVKNRKLYDELSFHLRDNPKALSNLEDLRLISKDLLNPPTVKTARGSAKGGMDEARNTKVEIYNELSNKFLDMIAGKPGQKTAKLITDPNWDKKIAQILELSKGQKMTAATSKQLGRVISQAVAASTSEPDKKGNK